MRLERGTADGAQDSASTWFRSRPRVSVSLPMLFSPLQLLPCCISHLNPATSADGIVVLLYCHSAFKLIPLSNIYARWTPILAVSSVTHESSFCTTYFVGL